MRASFAQRQERKGFRQRGHKRELVSHQAYPKLHVPSHIYSKPQFFIFHGYWKFSPQLCTHTMGPFTVGTCQACAQLASGLARAGAFIPAIWTRLESEVNVIITPNTSPICYTSRPHLYVPDAWWCTMECELCLAPPWSRGKRGSPPSQDSRVNALSMFSLGSLASVNGPNIWIKQKFKGWGGAVVTGSFTKKYSFLF